MAEEDEQVFGIPGEIMRKAIKIGKDFLTHSAYAYSMMGSNLTIKKGQVCSGTHQTGTDYDGRTVRTGKTLSGQVFQE